MARTARSVYSIWWWLKAGWPAGALGAACMACLSLIVNLSVLIWALKSFEFTLGVAEIYAGDCQKSQTINTWVHLGINAVSTVLLSGSNYCMQVLSAPTRAEVDKAHASQRWLDIGIPSVRNLVSVWRAKLIMWLLLVVSSLPLHLMYNSVFFSTIASNEYLVYATEGFLKDDTYNKSDFSTLEDIQRRAATWERLENIDCITKYAVDYLSTRRHLVLVTADNDPDQNRSVKDVASYDLLSNPYDWICNTNDGIQRYGFIPLEAKESSLCSEKIGKVKAHAPLYSQPQSLHRYCRHYLQPQQDHPNVYNCLLGERHAFDDFG